VKKSARHIAKGAVLLNLRKDLLSLSKIRKGKVIPAKAGVYSNMLIFLVEWMSARLWRITNLRRHDLNY